MAVSGSVISGTVENPIETESRDGVVYADDFDSTNHYSPESIVDHGMNEGF